MSTIKICQYCQEPFPAKRVDTKFCSSRCKHRHFIAKDAEVETMDILPYTSPFQKNVSETDHPVLENVSPRDKTIVPSQTSVKPHKRRHYPFIEDDYEEFKPRNSQETEEEDRYFLNGREVTKEEYENASKPLPRQLTYHEIVHIREVNKTVYSWIKTCFQMENKPFIKIEELKGFSEQISNFKKGNAYKILPKEYSFLKFIDSLSEKFKRIVLEMDLNDTEKVEVEITNEFRKECNEVALAIKGFERPY